MKKRFVSLLLLVVMVFTLGFGTNEALAAKAKTKKPAKAPNLKGSITIAGSTSVQPFSEVLAETFMKKYPKVRVNVQGGGSAVGIEAARSGAAQIGSSSRELKPDEKKDLQEFVIAKDGIVLIVHPSNPVKYLSKKETRDIFSGKITNWKQVGGKDAKITLVAREAGSGTRDGFESIVMNKQPVSDKALICNSTGAVKATVANNPDAIGYISIAAVDKSVKAVAFDGWHPSKADILKGNYPLSRPFLYLTKSKPTGVTKAFIDFVLSKEGQKILEKEGAVAVR